MDLQFIIAIEVSMQYVLYKHAAFSMEITTLNSPALNIVPVWRAL